MAALAWLLPLAGEAENLFGLQGWYDLQAFTEASATPNPPFEIRNWSLLFLVGNSPESMRTFYWSSVAILVLFGLGIGARLTGILAWLAVVSFSDNPLIETESDVFLRMLGLYLMVGYLLIGQGEPGQSWLDRLVAPWAYSVFRRKPGAVRPSSAATVAVRLIQAHFAIAVLFMGLHKLQMAEWWSGIALWYPLNPASETTQESLRRWLGQRDFSLTLISLASYAMASWQLAFPLFAWRPGRWRWLLLVGALAGCLGLMFLFKIPTLGPVFLIFCLSYLTDAEWAGLFDPITRKWASGGPCESKARTPSKG
jgi:hypothetical protein